MSYKYNLHTQDGLLYYYPGVERENKCPIVVLLDAIEVNNNMLKNVVDMNSCDLNDEGSISMFSF